ncbi:probable ATP-dependent RNA helicase DDX4 [Aythya fuligula]|uniref:RNA helicase n=1 Tax=Aythya fuligula TaxID=219594 RepID=A0A6J3EE28_AYTFU|nr:probable ATP-dependent RNA helicase DDX4 [Aythya fuligula]
MILEDILGAEILVNVWTEINQCLDLVVKGVLGTEIFKKGTLKKAMVHKKEVLEEFLVSLGKKRVLEMSIETSLHRATFLVLEEGEQLEVIQVTVIMKTTCMPWMNAKSRACTEPRMFQLLVLPCQRLRVSQEQGGDTVRTEGPKVTYIPPPPPDDEETIFARYQTGINFDKYDENIVEVSGLDPPAPLMSFEEASLCQTLNKNIARAGYSKLTPVQKYSIPIILAGRDLMACAQTGSGKTAAFLLPIVAQMMRDGVTASSFKKQQEPECIIVAPTRELINQIFLEARKFVYGTCIRPVVIYGGTQTGHSIRQIMQGCNILCATPGRLLDIIGKEKIGLCELKYLVLDEADRMLDMGFGLDMKKLISSPDMPSKEKRQTLMFSATFPEEVQRLAGEFLKMDYLFVVVGHVGGACSDVQQSILLVPQYSKRDKLIEILHMTGNERTMVFVETKKKADYIAAFLCQENIPTTSIHGDREQREREVALQDFRSGKCPVLVATSVAARGLDIENVQHVINFDLPSTIEVYVHRIGRTGRCGNTGKAISFFDNGSDGHLAQPLVKVLSDAHQEVPVWLEELAFSVQRTNPVMSVNTQKSYEVSSSMNPERERMSSSANSFESWD